MRVWAFARSLRLAHTERQKCAHVLMAALSKLGFPNYLEFEHKIEDYDRAQRDAESARAVLMDICEAEDPEKVEESLESEAASLGRQRNAIEQELTELGGAGIGDAELAKLKAERDMLVPAASQILDRVEAHWRVSLCGKGLFDPVLGNGVEKSPLIAEEPVDGRRLHPGGQAHCAGGDRLAATVSQQTCRCREDAVPIRCHARSG